jgi:hypothetical protein
MRALTLSLLAVLALTSAARADLPPPPGLKYTSGSAVVLFGPEAEGYRVFVVCEELVSSLPLSAERVAVVRAYGGRYRASNMNLFAIPANTPVPERPTIEWLSGVPGVVGSGPMKVYARGSAMLLDPRDGDEFHYRATLTNREIKLELIETRAVWSWPTVVVMGFLSLALALGGIWLIRRRNARRSRPPTDPSGG